jgi:hypothetical protein
VNAAASGEIAGDWFASGGAGALDGALRKARDERFTGRLGARDAAGIGIHLVDGLITAVVTPMAPGPDSLLVKSGRVGQADWSWAVDATGGHEALDEALFSRSLVGRGELDVIRAAALFDGIFAVLLDAPAAWEAEQGGASGFEPVLPLTPGVPPETALAEAARRHAQLSRRWGRPAQLARTRPLATAKAAQQGPGITPRHRELVLCANGRRTPRDIAFVLGRGLYAVMIDICQAERRGLLQTREQAAPATLPSAAPRRAEPAPDEAGTRAGSEPGEEGAPPDSAPRRLPQRPARRPGAGRAEGMTPYSSFERTHTE